MDKPRTLKSRTHMRLLIALTLLLPFACHPQKSNNLEHPELEPSVGTTSFIWTDTVRVDPHYGGHRIINVRAWYPSQRMSDNTAYDTASYYYGDKTIWSQLQGWTDDDIDFVSRIKMQAIVNAPFSSSHKNCPLIVFSPSLGGNLSFYGYYAEELASRGYIVMGVNHMYESDFVIDQNNTIIQQNLTFHDSLKNLDIPTQITADEYRKVKGQRTSVLGEDLAFALSKIISDTTSQFSGQVDLDKVAVWGHSVGGAAAIQVALIDPRFKAVLNIDGTPPTLLNSQPLGVPYMFIEDLPDYDSHEGLLKQYNRRNEFCESVDSRSYRVLIGGANHRSFQDLNFYSAEGETEKENALRLLDLAVSYMSTFFDEVFFNVESGLINLKSDTLEVKVFEE